jgi:competence protein ComFC
MIKPGLLADAVLNFIYPPIHCIWCERRLEKRAVHGICSHCIDAMPFIHPPRCSVCGKPAETEMLICTECRLHGHDYNQALAVFEYSITIRELIHRYKYNGEYTLSRTFGYFMSELLMQSGWRVDAIIPVPLHKNRLKSRGFNQSALLADYLSHRSGIPCLENLLIRRVDTKTQTGFNRYRRADNLKGAFSIVKPHDLEDKNILLVDDVHTSGATADSCSRVLHQAGVNKVYVLTLAAVLSESELHDI